MGLDQYLYKGDEQVGYWRKANQIHRWFVENVQDGVDNCGEYTVTREKLDELLTNVYYVLKKPEQAKDILPSQPGFFFGQYEYNDWYMQDINDTKHILEEVLSDKSTDSWTYHSSW
jgi:hypothetical protein